METIATVTSSITTNALQQGVWVRHVDCPSPYGNFVWIKFKLLPFSEVTTIQIQQRSKMISLTCPLSAVAEVTTSQRIIKFAFVSLYINYSGTIILRTKLSRNPFVIDQQLVNPLNNLDAAKKVKWMKRINNTLDKISWW